MSQQAPQVRRILIECTNTYSVKLNTGIQRVVRNIVRHSEEVGAELSVECVPVMVSFGEFYRLPFELQVDVGAQRAKHAPKLSSRFLTRCYKIFFPRTMYRKVMTLYRSLRGLRVVPTANDVLLLLDATWNIDNWDTIRRAKQQGAAIGTVVYDLIPVTHPQFCADQLVESFRESLANTLDASDFVVSISQTVSNDVQNHAAQQGFTHLRPDRSFDHFQLGCNLDHTTANEEPGHDLRSAFDGGPTYLMVGTVEPRKNHTYAVDAFEKVWETCPTAQLCIVGREGWKCEKLVQRIEQHERFGRQLFWFQGISDTELEYCYRNSQALIYPSFVEGYGLPLIEALHRGLRVMASSTPIHREVGRDCCAYFELNDPNSLAQLVTNLEQRNHYPPVAGPEEIRILDWHGSCEQLMTNVLGLAGKLDSATQPAPAPQRTRAA